MRYCFDDIEINTTNYTLQRDGKPLSVEPQVFDLIVFFIQNRDRLLTRDEIFDEVWDGRIVSDTSLSNAVKMARRVLGDNAQKQNIIKTIRGRGYQFCANVDEAPSLSRIIAEPNKPNTKLFQLTLIALLVTIVVFALPRAYEKMKPVTPTLADATLAILPLTNTRPDEDTDFLGLALTDQMIGRVSYIEDVTVRPFASVRQYENTSLDAVKIGTALNVKYVLSGNYLKDEDEIRLSFELIDVSSGGVVWREHVELNEDNVFELQDAVATKIFIRFKAKNIKNRGLIDQHTISQSPLAYEYYLRSIAYPLTEDGDGLAVDMLLQAVALDPNFAPAYAELGIRTHKLSAHSMGGDKHASDAEHYLLKALSLNPNSLSALENLTIVYTDTGRILEAFATAKKILAINPNYAEAFFSLGYLYRYAGMLEKSIQMMDKALVIDPHNRKFRSAGVTYYSAGQYEKAHAAFDVDKGTAYTLSWHAILYHHEGQNEKAVAYFDKTIALEPNGYFALDSKAYKAVILGDKETALRAVALLENTEVRDVEVMYFWALYYAGIHEKEDCLRILRKVVKGGYANVPAMEREPFFDFLRNDSEFIELMSMARQQHLAFKGVINNP